MRDHYPFIVRLQDGREWRGYARSIVLAERQAQVALDGAVRIGLAGSVNPAVLIIRADEPFVRQRPGRFWRWLFRGAP